MDPRNPIRRGLLSLVLGSLLAAGSYAIAGEPLTDETRIAVRTQSGAIEKITVTDIDAFATGETRAFTTDNGNAATLTRTQDGVVLALAGERFEIALDTTALAHAHAHALAHASSEGDRVIVRKHADTQNVEQREVKRKVIIRHGEGHDDGLGDFDLDALGLDESELLAGGGARIQVTRRVRKHVDAAQ